MTETDDDQTYVSTCPPALAIPDLVKSCVPLDGLVHAYMWWAAPTTHAPAQYHLGAILPVLAYEAARRGIFVGNQRRLPRIWTGLVGASGAAKSTAHHHAIEFTRDWLSNYRGGDYRDPFFHLDGSMPGILAASTTAYDAELQASVGIYETDEMSKILSQLDSVSETLCKIFDGHTVTRHLRQFQQAKAAGERVADELVNPAFSASFASTPSSLERVTEGYHLEGGLFSRILWFRGAVRPEELMPAEVHRDRARAQVLRLWDDWSRWLDTELLTRGALARHVSIPAHIQQMLTAHLFEPYRQKLCEDNRVNPAILRGAVYGELITGLFALTRGDYTADEDDATAAINIVEGCHQTVDYLDRTIVVDEITRLREKVLAIIRAAGDDGVTRARIYRALNVSKKVLDEAMQTLLDSEIVGETLHTGGVGRPRTTYHLKQRP